MPQTVLNVGCGYSLRQKLHPHFQLEEWQEIRLDLDPAVQPDIVCSITDMSPVLDCSIDAIWSSHNLEHLQRHEVPQALNEMIRVLRPGGLLLIILPDLRQVAQLVVEDRLEDQAYTSPSGPITALDMIFGRTTSLARGKQFMAHHTGFTAAALQRALLIAGFVDIWIRQGNCLNLRQTLANPRDEISSSIRISRAIPACGAPFGAGRA